jgi:hypothetical protein
VANKAINLESILFLIFRKYYGEDEAYRFAVYNMNLAKIAEHNAKGLSWTMGVN